MYVDKFGYNPTLYIELGDNALFIVQQHKHVHIKYAYFLLVISLFSVYVYVCLCMDVFVYALLQALEKDADDNEQFFACMVTSYIKRRWWWGGWGWVFITVTNFYIYSFMQIYPRSPLMGALSRVPCPLCVFIELK